MIPAPHRALAPIATLAGILALAPCAEAQFSAPQVELQGAAGPIVVDVEVARSDEEKARGLMFRTELKPSAGMIFVYDYDAPHSFWMKNTYIPLDMIFIDRDLKIVGVVENAEPLTTTSRKVDTPSRYILEVNAGFFRRHGLKIGGSVVLRGIETSRAN